MTPEFRTYLEGLDQISDEWHEHRLGCITASQARRLLTVTEKGLPKFVESIIFGGRDIGHLAPVARGKRLEDWGVMAWETRNGITVRRVGLLVHRDFDMIRCSPDGLIGDTGGLEVKCPTRREEHLCVLAGTVPEMHVPQVQFSLWVSGLEFWDLVSWKPDEPKRYNYGCVRNLPDRRMFAKFEARARLVLPLLEAA